MKNKKTVSKEAPLRFDKASSWIWSYLNRIPYVGVYFSKLYAWRPMMFNYMIVGASGTILNWILYELLFRPLVSGFFGGTFLGIALVTVIVYFWNFTWNKRWSLKPISQIQKMKKQDLQALDQEIKLLLLNKFDAKGERL